MEDTGENFESMKTAVGWGAHKYVYPKNNSVRETSECASHRKCGN